MNFPAPRGEPELPLRSLAPMMTGAAVAVERIPISAFNPRTPE